MLRLAYLMLAASSFWRRKTRNQLNENRIKSRALPTMLFRAWLCFQHRPQCDSDRKIQVSETECGIVYECGGGRRREPQCGCMVLLPHRAILSPLVASHLKSATRQKLR